MGTQQAIEHIENGIYYYYSCCNQLNSLYIAPIGPCRGKAYPDDMHCQQVMVRLTSCRGQLPCIASGRTFRKNTKTKQCCNAMIPDLNITFTFRLDYYIASFD
eukprot:scaffold208144_cov21-Prasinocladus_malaysianus.AAC.1